MTKEGFWIRFRKSSIVNQILAVATVLLAFGTGWLAIKTGQLVDKTEGLVMQTKDLSNKTADLVADSKEQTKTFQEQLTLTRERDNLQHISDTLSNYYVRRSVEIADSSMRVMNRAEVTIETGMLLPIVPNIPCTIPIIIRNVGNTTATDCWYSYNSEIIAYNKILRTDTLTEWKMSDVRQGGVWEFHIPIRAYSENELGIVVNKKSRLAIYFKVGYLSFGIRMNAFYEANILIKYTETDQYILSIQEISEKRVRNKQNK